MASGCVLGSGGGVQPTRRSLARSPAPTWSLGGERGATMAVTIEVPSDQVWPWLAQMGGDRAGWYSWDRLDNGGRPSAHEVHPEWQDLSLGDYVKYWRAGGPV